MSILNIVDNGNNGRNIQMITSTALLLQRLRLLSIQLFIIPSF